MTTIHEWVGKFRDWGKVNNSPKTDLKEFESMLNELESMLENKEVELEGMAEELADARAALVPEALQEYEKSEKRVQKELRLAAQDLDGMLLRNNSGVAREPDVHNGVRIVRYGLGNTSVVLNRRFKSSDLIGVMPITVGLKHIGRTFGVFAAVETKRPGFKFKLGDSRIMAQANFLMTVNNLGGLGIFATGPDDLKRGIEKRFYA